MNLFDSAMFNAQGGGCAYHLERVTHLARFVIGAPVGLLDWLRAYRDKLQAEHPECQYRIITAASAGGLELDRAVVVPDEFTE